jgi:hypothetical protein
MTRVEDDIDAIGFGRKHVGAVVEVLRQLSLLMRRKASIVVTDRALNRNIQTKPNQTKPKDGRLRDGGLGGVSGVTLIASERSKFGRSWDGRRLSGERFVEGREDATAGGGASDEGRPRFAAAVARGGRRERDRLRGCVGSVSICGIDSGSGSTSSAPSRHSFGRMCQGSIRAVGVSESLFQCRSQHQKSNRRRRKRCVLVRLLESMHIEGVPD